MTAQEITKRYNELSTDAQKEIAEFIKFLEYQSAKDRMLKSDEEDPKEKFDSVGSLMKAIDSCPDEN